MEKFREIDTAFNRIGSRWKQFGSKNKKTEWLYIDAIFNQFPSLVLYNKHRLVARMHIKEIKDINLAETLSGFNKSRNV